ncbi:MAG: DsrE/DsrF/DrsH-like family protein [Rhodothermales bacterium]
MEATSELAKSMTTPKAEKNPIQKVLIICSKGTLEDVYAALIMANGALMEGIEAEMFFTFFGLEAIKKDAQDHLHTATVGNPALMRQMPTLLAGLPGFEALVSTMMKKEMEKLDIPPVSEFLEIISESGGKLHACRLAVDMFKLKREDFIDQLDDIITVGEMYALAEGKNTHIIFI